MINACCVGEYLYEFIKVDGKNMKLNIVSRSTAKNINYSALENEITMSLMQRQKNLLITYDNNDNLNFWR